MSLSAGWPWAVCYIGSCPSRQRRQDLAPWVPCEAEGEERVSLAICFFIFQLVLDATRAVCVGSRLMKTEERQAGNLAVFLRTIRFVCLGLFLFVFR